MGPQGWAFQYDAIFQLIFAIITVAIGFFALKIYSFTKDRTTKNFGLSFLSIAASFLILAFMNLGILDWLAPLGFDPEGLLRLTLASYMGLYIIGAITLAYVALNVLNDKAFYIMVLITFGAIIAATHKLYLFYSIATILFGYVFYQYAKHYQKKKNSRAFLVMTGFFFLFIANLSLIFSVQNNLYYILGHVLELAGYCSLLLNFIIIRLK